jgi:hydroxymethylpyrimidine pyrophosphatase-like HAD family hydrolase
MVGLIGIDVDGTLLDSDGRMPDENRDAIHDAIARGIHVALVTGRSFPFARPVADTLPSSVSLIVSNGALERAMDGTTLARRLLRRDVARAVLAATAGRRDAAALIFDRDADRQVVFESMDWEHPGRKNYWTRNRSLIAQCVPLEEALEEDPIQVMFNGGVEEMRELADALRAGMPCDFPVQREDSVFGGVHPPAADDRRLQPDEYAVSLTEYVHRDFSLIDVTAPDATKGRALAWCAARLGLTPSQVMAVGDNFNDIEMLEYAGVPVVMANAVPGLKRRGWHETGHQNEAGLAQAIRRFALG